ncbi:DUF397 domain-containing protein [Streptomyces sp. DG1A-41]|uniref:DUF397 domain-containing protein n=1 Tax=Streptomyces sp. DG1A-41 TaxID=3125779 RepID=UPI0030CDE3F6
MGQEGGRAAWAFGGQVGGQGVSYGPVEVATTPATVHVRDSKHTAGPRLAVAPAAWADFVTYASGS